MKASFKEASMHVARCEPLHRAGTPTMTLVLLRSDFEMATKIAVDMVEKFGMSDAVGYVAYSNSASNRGGGAAAISDAQRKVQTDSLFNRRSSHVLSPSFALSLFIRWLALHSRARSVFACLPFIRAVASFSQTLHGAPCRPRRYSHGFLHHVHAYTCCRC